MHAQFLDLHAAADFLGPGAIEVNRFVEDIRDILRRRNAFGMRIKQKPATGHPSRFFEQDRYGTDGKEKSVPLKALILQLHYDVVEDVPGQQPHFAYLQSKDLIDAVEGLMRTHDVALWNGTDTSLVCPTTPQYYGVGAQIMDAGSFSEFPPELGIMDSLKGVVAQLASHGSKPTAIYANPVLLDLLDRELKLNFNIQLPVLEIQGGLRVKTLSTQAGELPLIPEWSIAYTGVPGSGVAVLPAYVISEDLVEYHWLTDPNPRVFQLGLSGSLAKQNVVVKFGAVVVKNADFAHYKLNFKR
jgi:hypothetical protein